PSDAGYPYVRITRVLSGRPPSPRSAPPGDPVGLPRSPAACTARGGRRPSGAPRRPARVPRRRTPARAGRPPARRARSSDTPARDLEVLDARPRARLRPAAVPPSLVMRYHDGRLASFDVGPVRDYLMRELLPVSFGDVVMDTKRGFAIASGDDVILELAKLFR